MPGLLVIDGAIMVRAGGLVVGPCPSCCAPPADTHYYQFTPCNAPSLDPCGLQEPLIGGPIYVAANLVCNGTGQTVAAFVLSRLPNEQAVILWGGWCYVFTGACFFPSCPQPVATGCGAACNVLPVGAQGPSGGVQCLPGACDGPPCGGPMYAFFKRCPGQPVLPPGAAPEYYVCLSQLEAFFAAGGRCPVYSLAGFGCWYVDWQNASPTKPANYNQYLGSPNHDGCCSCLGPPCVSAVPSACVVSPGFTGAYDPRRCCAHAELGTATIEWAIVSRINGVLDFAKYGSATRSGLVLSGSWTREQAGAPNETFGISGVFSTSSNFGVVETLSPDTVSGLLEKTWAGFPCPGNQGTTGSWSGSCTRFTMTAREFPPGSGFRTLDYSVTYSCSPNPGICADGCSFNGVSGGSAPATDPAAPNPLLDFGPMLRALQ